MARRKSDDELIKAFKRGDTSSFEELIGRYSSKAFSLASRLTGSVEDAEEVLQDAFVTVFRKVDGFEGKSQFSSWFYRVTVNAALMKLRKRKNNPSLSLDDEIVQRNELPKIPVSPLSYGDVTTFRGEVSTALDLAIRELPEEYRPVFVLRDVDGLTSKEVAKILDISIPAVKSRLHRSRMMLRRKLTPLYEELHGGTVPLKVSNI